VKTKEREQAIELRRSQGLSLSEIARQVGASKGRVSEWVRHVVLTEEQKQQLTAHAGRTIGSYGTATQKKISNGIERRSGWRLAGRLEAAKNGLDLYLAGCMLFWAEGAKARNLFSFSNSDPDMIKLFLRFLRESCGVPDSMITVRIQGYLNNGIAKEDIESYWLAITGLASSQLRKGTYDAYSVRSKRRKRNLVFGTAYINVCSTELVQKIYGSICEYASTDGSRWP
jgi:transcriptional regulator with XRE-family HTH domain